LTIASERPRLAAARRWLPHAVFALGAVTIAVGLSVRRFTDTPIGVPWPPALGNPDLGIHPLIAVSLALFAAAVVLTPRLLDERVRPGAVALILFGGTLALRLALAAGRGGTGEWSKVFDTARSFEAPNEYLPALPTVDAYGPRLFLDRFAELVPAMPVHVAGHPPGLPLVMHLLGLDTPGRLAAFCIVAGALAAPLTYALARELLPERAARVAGLLMALSPQALLMGVTTADAVYATLGLLAAWPLIQATNATNATNVPGTFVALGALMLAVASLFAWSLLAVGAWAAVLVWRRRGLRAAIWLSVICGVVLVAFHAALAALTGFDPIGTVRATEDVYRLGIASIRPYWYWLFGSPVGFLLVLGIPISWLALRELARGTPEAVAIFTVLAIAAVIGFTKAETERIWLFFAPFVCLAAARALHRRPGLLVPVAAALAAQALLHEALSDTVW
jgi:methylthioxylose transferase